MGQFQISGKMKWKLKKLQELTCFFWRVAKLNFYCLANARNVIVDFKYDGFCM